MSSNNDEEKEHSISTDSNNTSGNDNKNVNVLTNKEIRIQREKEKEQRRLDFEAKKKEKKKKEYISSIKHRFEDEYFNLFKVKVDKFAKKIFNDVHVNNLNNLSGLDKDFSLVFVSNHKSLADVFLISKVFVKHDFDIPRFVGGSNLYVPFFTSPPLVFGLPDLRKVGMISVDRTQFKKRNITYTQGWSEYMSSFFKGNENLVFFPEGGRSYSGELNELKRGLFKLMLNNCDDNTLLVPVFCGYDLVVDAVGFEHYKSTKSADSDKSVNFFNKIKNSKKTFDRFVADYKLFRNHYKNNVFLRNDAEFNVGSPVKVKSKSIDELISYTMNSFLSLTKVSCAEISSYAFNNLKNGEVKTRNLVNETERLLSFTPVENMNSKLLSFRNDPEKVLDTGITNINSQNPSIVTALSKMNVVNEFLVNYYSNSVSDFYNRLV